MAVTHYLVSDSSLSIWIHLFLLILLQPVTNWQFIRSPVDFAAAAIWRLKSYLLFSFWVAALSLQFHTRLRLSVETQSCFLVQVRVWVFLNLRHSFYRILHTNVHSLPLKVHIKHQLQIQTSGLWMEVPWKYMKNLTFFFLLETLAFLPSSGLLVALAFSSPASSLRNCGASRASTAPSSLMSCRQDLKDQKVVTTVYVCIWQIIHDFPCHWWCDFPA